ncbi:hypothetical protein FRC03_004786 [Tulasnella sp. 419]|nr:hypothetical protein FRC03_004786 [Tulasnella sp. 419]
MARDIVSDDENASDRWEDIDEQDLSNLFEYNGMPLKVHLHSSLRSSEYQIRVIRDTLEAHGADPYVKLEDARFIIVNPYKNDFKRLLEEYSACPCVWIVRPGWVQKCIRYKTVIEARGRFKKIAYGKRYDDGEQRVRFTKRDDENMTRYLASRSPLVNWDQNDDQRKSRFKRAGKKVYEDLVRSDRLWASRHSLESWRNRYTKNMDHFDEWIEKHVANERPELLNDFDMRMEMDLRDDQMVDSDTEEGEGWDEEVPPLPRQAIAFMKEKDLLPSRRGPSPGKEDPRSDAYVLDSSSESEEERVESDSEEDIPQVRPSRRAARRTRVAEDDEQEDRGWVEELVGDQRQSEERNWYDLPT